jgi:hypothetical protein
LYDLRGNINLIPVLAYYGHELMKNYYGYEIFWENYVHISENTEIYIYTIILPNKEKKISIFNTY